MTSLAKIGSPIGPNLPVDTGFAFPRALSARAKQPIKQIRSFKLIFLSVLLNAKIGLSQKHSG